MDETVQQEISRRSRSEEECAESGIWSCRQGWGGESESGETPSR